MRGCSEYETNIPLYVDGELIGEEKSEFISHLENCPQCRQALQEAEAFSQRIRAARPAVEAPESLRTAVSRQAQAAGIAMGGPHIVPPRILTPRRSWLLTAAAVILALVTGSLLVSRQHHVSETRTMIQAALLAHRGLEQHTLPLDISSDSSQEVAAWFQRRVSFPFHMADSGIAADITARYKLTGGRLLIVDNEPVAMVVFSLPHELVTLLVCPERLMKASGGRIVESGGIALHGRDEGSQHVVIWNERGLGYVLASTSNTMANPRQCSSCHAESSASEKTSRASMLPSM